MSGLSVFKRSFNKRDNILTSCDNESDHTNLFRETYHKESQKINDNQGEIFVTDRLPRGLTSITCNDLLRFKKKKKIIDKEVSKAIFL